jgi:hypothetical protein
MTRDTIFVLKVFGVPRGVTPIAQRSADGVVGAEASA